VEEHHGDTADEDCDRKAEEQPAIALDGDAQQHQMAPDGAEADGGQSRPP
jgi:hypothetical protein